MPDVPTSLLDDVDRLLLFLHSCLQEDGGKKHQKMGGSGNPILIANGIMKQIELLTSKYYGGGGIPKLSQGILPQASLLL